MIGEIECGKSIAAEAAHIPIRPEYLSGKELTPLLQKDHNCPGAGG